MGEDRQIQYNFTMRYTYPVSTTIGLWVYTLGFAGFAVWTLYLQASGNAQFSPWWFSIVLSYFFFLAAIMYLFDWLLLRPISITSTEVVAFLGEREIKSIKWTEITSVLGIRKQNREKGIPDLIYFCGPHGKVRVAKSIDGYADVIDRTNHFIIENNLTACAVDHRLNAKLQQIVHGPGTILEKIMVLNGGVMNKVHRFNHD